MAKHNHKKQDFLSALNLNVDDLFEISKVGFDMHFIERRPISECVEKMAEMMKTQVSSEVKIFAAGMVFAQLLEAAKQKHGTLDDLLEKSIRLEKKKKTLPFTGKDLMKSIKDELENEKGEGTEDNAGK